MTPPASPPSVHVLIVDDNVESAELLKELLQMEGHVVDLAHDAAGGRTALQRRAYQAALIDLSLPDQHGTEMARLLRDDPAAQRPLPVLVAVTGHERGGPFAGDVDRYFDHYLQKPVDIDVLLGLLARLGGRAQ